MVNMQHTCGKRVGEANYIKYGEQKMGNSDIDALVVVKVLLILTRTKLTCHLLING